jgi:hypothetical protein
MGVILWELQKQCAEVGLSRSDGLGQSMWEDFAETCAWV